MTHKTTVSTIALAILMTAAASVGLARSPATRGGTAFDAVLAPYEAIHRSLAVDSLEGVARNARSIRDIARNAAADFKSTTAGVPGNRASRCRVLLPKVEQAAARLARATTLDQAREAFGELSRPIVQWREMSTSAHKPYVVFCPMAKKPWLQESKQIANPYFGSKMPKCGTIVSK